MRIIGGEWGGRRLYAPEGMDTRPTADRVREALFNILRNRLEGAHTLDLFAGSGALSLEALSRGAEYAVMTEASRKAAAAIRRNAELCGAGERARLIVSEWQAAIPSLRGQRFSLVFLDPPYRMIEAYAQAAYRLQQEGLLADGACLVMEHARGVEIPGLAPDFEVFDTRRYGDVCISLARVRSDGE